MRLHRHLGGLVSLLLALSFGTMASAEDRASKPGAEASKHVLTPQVPLGLVPLPPGMVPKRDGKPLEVLQWAPLKGVDGEKSAWLTPSQLRAKLWDVRAALGSTSSRVVGLHVLVPCKVNSTIWLPEKGKKSKPPIHAQLMPCLSTATHPGGKATKGLVVAFSSNRSAVMRRMRAAGFGATELFSAMLVVHLDDLKVLVERLAGRFAVLADPQRSSSPGTVSSTRVLLRPKRPPTHQKPPTATP